MQPGPAGVSTTRGWKEAELRRNQLGGQIGTDPNFTPTSHTGHPRPPFAISPAGRALRLTEEERAIIDGRRGAVLQKTIRTIVDFGEFFGAARLIPLSGAPHHAVSWGSSGNEPLIRLYRALVRAGLRTYAPFTSNPKPTDAVRLPLDPSQQQSLDRIYDRADELEALNLALGLRSPEDWSCACYEPEMGNTPEYGDHLAWSESSAIAYVNSVIGARSNRNPPGIDMLCNILGRAPYFGLMTDRGRQATQRVEIATSRLPHPQILGSAIGLWVPEEVPYITGLERFIPRIDPKSSGYFKDLGAAISGNGGSALFHIEGVTPEARHWGRDLLCADHDTRVIDDDELERVHTGYPNLWKHRHGTPKRVFVGCPHLTVEQMADWGRRIVEAVDKAGTSAIGMPTYLFGSAHVRRAFETRHPKLADRLRELGVSIPTNCPMMWCSTPLEDAELVATNASKTRVYSTARFFLDDVLIELIVTGELPETAR